MIMKVVNLDFEEICLIRYEKIVEFIVNKMEVDASLEDDLLALSGNEAKILEMNLCPNLSKNEYLAILYRSE